MVTWDFCSIALLTRNRETKMQSQYRGSQTIGQTHYITERRKTEKRNLKEISLVHTVEAAVVTAFSQFFVFLALKRGLIQDKEAKT